MLKLKVNDIDVEVEEGTTVLQACLLYTSDAADDC